ncbi:MAG TPA: hypothetical protein VEN29_20360 [Casimicrobiaceae bacterium]|nr:hypothetical protein [Casimicrobiaceae bacterium]
MLNSETDGDDWLEQALRGEGHEHRSVYIADDGFTAAVVARLPRPVTVPAWRRAAVVLLWLCAGVAALLIVPGAFDQAFRATLGMIVGQHWGLADVAGLLMLFAAMTWGAVVYAMRTD